MFKYLFILIAIIITAIISILNSITNVFYILLIFIGFTILVTITFFILLYLVSLTMSNKKIYTTKSKIVDCFFNEVLRLLEDLFNVKVKVTNKELLPNEKSLYVYNHRSNFDPMIMAERFRDKNMVHISKPGNFKIPIAGEFARRNCYIEMSKTSPRDALKSINQAIEFIKDDKYNVGVAPEGTRNKTDDALIDFKDGCFKIALKAHCPIVVCTLTNCKDIHKNAPFKRTKVELKVVRVLNYEEFKDLKTHEISDMVKEIMINDLCGGE